MRVARQEGECQWPSLLIHLCPTKLTQGSRRSGVPGSASTNGWPVWAMPCCAFLVELPRGLARRVIRRLWIVRGCRKARGFDHQQRVIAEIIQRIPVLVKCRDHLHGFANAGGSPGELPSVGRDQVAWVGPALHRLCISAAVPVSGAMADGRSHAVVHSVGCGPSVSRRLRPLAFALDRA